MNTNKKTFAETATITRRPNCDRCDNDVTREGGVHIRKQVSPKIARVVEVLCHGCAA